jgi:Holliday junction resolvase RusA-like endonuclease
MNEITFFVEGVPRAKQSFRASRNGGHGFTPAYIKAWQADVGWAGQQAMRALGLVDPFEGNLTVTLMFFLPDLRRIDLDNLSKAVQDGLNGVVWGDDKQNVCLVLRKYICRDRQGVLVQVEPNDRPIEVWGEVIDIILRQTGMMIPVSTVFGSANEVKLEPA